ncbi:MAG TPA: carbohydrate porin, partial [Candidatus Cybelea sp.]|nr:carbohydrate porin [Candidatus Cybelea sp.]
TVLAASASARADDALKQYLAGSGATGDWGGYRTKLEQAGVNLGVDYISENAYNATGGTKHLVDYDDQWAFTGDFDLDHLLALHDAEFKLAITKRNGRNLSDDAHLGTLQQVQEVFGRGQTWRLTQFWYDQKYFDKFLDWKLGRLTMGEDFAAFDCAFMNLTFCGSQPGNLVGNYWFNWPVSQWATRVKLNFTDQVSFQAGAYQVNPHFLDTTDAVLPIIPAGTTGVMVPIELQWSPKVGPQQLGGSYKLGAWYDNSDANDVFDDKNHDPAVLTGLSPARRHGRYGVYVNFLQQVMRFDGDDATRGLNLFLNVTFADRRTSTLDNQIAVGMTAKGVFDARPADEIGLAVGRTHVNGNVAHGEELVNHAGPGNPADVQGAEYAVELYYGLQATNWFVARPNIQYISDPGGTSHNKDVWIIGLKTDLKF